MIKELTDLLELNEKQQAFLTSWVKDNVQAKTCGLTVTAEDVDASEIKDEGYLIELKRLKAASEAAPLHKLTKKESTVRADGKTDLVLEFKIQAVK